MILSLRVELMKKALFLLLVFALSFASHNWQYAAPGGITTKPVVLDSQVIVGAEDGKVYAVDVAAGTKKWDVSIGATPVDAIKFSDTVLVAAEEGKVSRITKSGEVSWTADLTQAPMNASRVYGLGISATEIYVTADNGLYRIDSTGNPTKVFELEDVTATPPFVGDNYVIFGAEKSLYKVKKTGEVEWESELGQGTFWTSRPVVSGNNIYVGALDNKLHCFFLFGGAERWAFDTKSWVMGSPVAEADAVFFGSNNGKFYSVSATSGSLLWEAETSLALEGKPEPGFMAGKEVLFVGGTDSNIYAIGKSDGEIIWKLAVLDWVGEPLFYQDSIIFGSADGMLYSQKTERACSVITPAEGAVIGHKELVVSGRALSQSGGTAVAVNINNGPWEQANLTDEEWEYIIDPAEKLNDGVNVLSCRVSDNAGIQEEGFSTVVVIRDSTMSLSNLVVTVSPDIIEGTPFTIFVNDGDDGSPVERFTLTINGDAFTGSSNITTTMESAGTYEVMVKKIGFEDRRIQLTVHSSGVNPFYIAGALILIILIVWQVWVRFLKERFAKKEE